MDAAFKQVLSCLVRCDSSRKLLNFSALWPLTMGLTASPETFPRLGDRRNSKSHKRSAKCYLPCRASVLRTGLLQETQCCVNSSGVRYTHKHKGASALQLGIAYKRKSLPPPKTKQNTTMDLTKHRMAESVPEPYSGLAAWPPPAPWRSARRRRGAPAAGPAWTPGLSSPWQCWGTRGWTAPGLPAFGSTAQSRLHGGSWKPAAAEQLLGKARELREHTAAESSFQTSNTSQGLGNPQVVS